jgi:hypothetical protein
VSVTIETLVACDKCGENNGCDDRCNSAKQIRARRKEDGWKKIGRYDFCPECADQARAFLDNLTTPGESG